MAQAVSRRPLTAESRVRAHVGFVVDKVVLRQVFLRVLRFSPVSIIPLWFFTLMQGLPQRGSRVACGLRMSLARLAQDTFHNVRVLRTNYFI